jgi:hypothetical protein
MNEQIQSHSFEQGNELDLIKLWKVFLRYKLLNIIVIVITTFGSVYYALSVPDVYEVKVVMLPVEKDNETGIGINDIAKKITGINLNNPAFINVNNASGEAIAILRTRSFLLNYIKEKKLKYILFADRWNAEKELWLDQEPSDNDAFDLFNEMIVISIDGSSGVVNPIYLYLRWEGPAPTVINKIADIANELADTINLNAKNNVIKGAKKNILFLEKELNNTSLLNLKTVIFSMIETQLHKVMLANTKDDFVFKIIDYAFNPSDKKPKHTLIIIFIGFISGVVLSFFLSIGVYTLRGKV